MTLDKMERPKHNYVFPDEVEFPHWSDDLRSMAYEFWAKWIGPNTVGYDEAIQDIGNLIDFAINNAKEATEVFYCSHCYLNQWTLLLASMVKAKNWAIIIKPICFNLGTCDYCDMPAEFIISFHSSGEKVKK
ncbi:hypothetical protein ES703_71030 [subsurface metagenome]